MKGCLRRLLRMVPMILVMGTIFFLSHQQGDTIDLGEIPGVDKLAHLLVYGVLAVTVLLAHAPGTRKNSPLQSCGTTVVVCLLYGLSDEFHQSFIPGRMVSAGDVAADTLGAAAACLLWIWREKRRVRRETV